MENKNQQAGIELRLSELKKDYAEKVNDIQRRRTKKNEEYVHNRENAFNDARKQKGELKADILNIDMRLCDDITNEERTELRKERIKLNRRLEEVNESRDEFLSVLYRNYNEDVHKLDEESRQMKENHELQRIELLNEYEIVRRTSNVELE